jgi:hypothetical protein
MVISTAGLSRKYVEGAVFRIHVMSVDVIQVIKA